MKKLLVLSFILTCFYGFCRNYEKESAHLPLCSQCYAMAGVAYDTAFDTYVSACYNAFNQTFQIVGMAWNQFFTGSFVSLAVNFTTALFDGSFFDAYYDVLAAEAAYEASLNGMIDQLNDCLSICIEN